MKLIALILSIIIFSQSLSVCAPAIYKSSTLVFKKENRMIVVSNGANKKHGCCKKAKNGEDSSRKKGCCDNSCKCLCCVSICLYDAPISSTTTSLPSSIHVERAISALFFHSFDFHSSIINPPRN